VTQTIPYGRGSGHKGGYADRALILGRALHAPWNEGTRVINRNFAVAAASRRQVRVVSLTRKSFGRDIRQSATTQPIVEHVYSSAGYDLLGVYRGLPGLIQYLSATSRQGSFSVGHLFPGLPLALAPYLRATGAKVVAHLMTTPAPRGVRALNSASTALFDRWVDAYVVTSAALCQPMLARGLKASKIFVVPPAIDIDVFQPGERGTARRSLGLDEDEAIVVYLGRLSPHRFPAELIGHALADTAKRISRRVRMVGLSPGQTYDGSENTSEYLRACGGLAAAELAKRTNILVDIRSGDLSDTQKVAWLQAADTVLLPFAVPEAVEPALTLLEALACGAVVVATRVANRSGIICDLKNGFIYDGPEQLADVLTTIFNGQGSPLSVAESARRTVEAQFSYAPVANSLERVWRQVERGSSRFTHKAE
jgi:glycosyltransferase involved in cell wall biosynthesis